MRFCFSYILLSAICACKSSTVQSYDQAFGSSWVAREWSKTNSKGMQWYQDRAYHAAYVRKWSKCIPHQTFSIFQRHHKYKFSIAINFIGSRVLHCFGIIAHESIVNAKARMIWFFKGSFIEYCFLPQWVDAVSANYGFVREFGPVFKLKWVVFCDRTSINFYKLLCKSSMDHTWTVASFSFCTNLTALCFVRTVTFGLS